MINPFLLRSFCALVEVGHFTRTAEQLNMTQSGVSQHVKKLEEQLGCALLIRQGKQFTLTEAGERLYQEGRELIRALSDLEKSVLLDPEFEGTVRVASPGSVGLKFYRHLLELQKQQPKLVIDYRFAPNADVERLIASNKIDIALMTSPTALEGVSFKALAEEELLLITPADVLSADWQQLMQLGFIDHPDGAHHASLLLGPNFAEFQHIKQFKKTGFSNQINLILEPVIRGMGFTVLPRYAVEAFSAVEQLKVQPLPKSVSETIYLGHHSNRFIASRVKTVIAQAEKCLS